MRPALAERERNRSGRAAASLQVRSHLLAFPVMLASRLWKADGLVDFDPYPMVLAAARFLVRHSPITQQERWEESSGYSPSTLAAIIAALICAADFARSRQQQSAASFLEEYAEFLESHVERWTVTTDGTLIPGISGHWSRDGWQTSSDSNSTDIALGSFVDIPVLQAQRAPVSFTFYWLPEGRWEGQD